MVKKAKFKFNLFHSKYIKPHHENRKVKKAVDSGVASFGIFSSFMAFPQVFKVYLTHNISSFSAVTWATSLLASVAWVIYGIFYKSKPIILSSSLSFTVNVLMVLSFFIFG